MHTIRENDDLLITPTLKARLRLEGEYDDADGSVWCVLQRSNGDKVEVLSQAALQAGHLPPLAEQVMFAHDMVGALNRHLHHDGKWIVAFTHPSEHSARVIGQAGAVYWNRWFFLWVDKDGDPQFTMENDDLFVETLTAGPDRWMEEAEQAWQTWKHHMRDVLDVSTKAQAEAVTFKRAQGQKAPSLANRLLGSSALH